MGNKASRISALDVALIVAPAILMVGVCTFAAPCPVAEGEAPMACHWAGRSVLGTAVVLVVIALARLLVREPGAKAGLALAMAPLSLLAALTPGPLINLCMMDTMRCHTVMRPCAVILGVVTCVVAIVAAVGGLRRAKG